MWQTKYATAVPKNLGLGLNFRPYSESYFFSGCPQSMLPPMVADFLAFWVWEALGRSIFGMMIIPAENRLLSVAFI